MSSLAFLHPASAFQDPGPLESPLDVDALELRSQFCRGTGSNPINLEDLDDPSLSDGPVDQSPAPLAALQAVPPPRRHTECNRLQSRHMAVDALFARLEPSLAVTNSRHNIALDPTSRVEGQSFTSQSDRSHGLSAQLPTPNESSRPSSAALSDDARPCKRPRLADHVPHKSLVGPSGAPAVPHAQPSIALMDVPDSVPSNPGLVTPHRTSDESGTIGLTLKRISSPSAHATPSADSPGRSVTRPSLQSLKPLGIPSDSQLQWTGAQARDLLKVDYAACREDQRYMTRNLLSKARASRASANERLQHVANDLTLMNGRNGKHLPVSPFLDMSSLSRPVANGAASKHTAHFECENLDGTGKRLRKRKLSFAVPLSTWSDDLVEVPSYTHHTVVAHNILGSNQKQLQNYPYFGEWATEEMYSRLLDHYDCDISARPRKLLRLHQAWHHEEMAGRYLSCLNVAEDTVLYYMLASSDQLDKLIKTVARECPDDLDRDSARWLQVFARLTEPHPLALSKAAMACAEFRRITKLSIWHIVRKSDLARLVPRSQQPDRQLSSAEVMQSLACRVCHMHDCMYHGESCEVLSGDEDDNSAKVAVLEAMDIDWPPNINRKRRIALPAKSLHLANRKSRAVDDQTDTEGGHAKSVSYRQQIKKRIEERSRIKYFPCHHPGLRCDQAACECFARGTLCEKACGCSTDCQRRFRGCSCRYGQRKCCYTDDRCDCYALGRECDVDLCGQCGVADVLDPANRQDQTSRAGRCQNAPMQLGIPRRTLLGRSGIHGFGLFAGEALRKHDFIGEYKGEILNEHESERRAQVYDIQNMSFLFGLNNEQDIDSALVGNKMRFINHALEKRDNVYIRISECNMSPRIGMFAQRAIESGEELFFNYGADYLKHIKLDSHLPFQAARIGVGVDDTGKRQSDTRAGDRDRDRHEEEEEEEEEEDSESEPSEDSADEEESASNQSRSTSREFKAASRAMKQEKITRETQASRPGQDTSRTPSRLLLRAAKSANASSTTSTVNGRSRLTSSRMTRHRSQSRPRRMSGLTIERVHGSGTRPPNFSESQSRSRRASSRSVNYDDSPSDSREGSMDESVYHENGRGTGAEPEDEDEILDSQGEPETGELTLGTNEDAGCVSRTEINSHTSVIEDVTHPAAELPSHRFEAVKLAADRDADETDDEPLLVTAAKRRKLAITGRVSGAKRGTSLICKKTVE